MNGPVMGDFNLEFSILIICLYKLNVDDRAEHELYRNMYYIAVKRHACLNALEWWITGNSSGHCTQM